VAAESVVSIPRGAEGLTAQWLSAALAASGNAEGADVASLAIERIGEGVGIIADLYRLTPRYAAGAAAGPASLIVKLPSTIAEIRQLAASYGLYEREVTFYRDVASTVSLRSPVSYFADFDPNSQAFAILMEDLAPAVSGDQIAGMTLAQLRLAIEDAAALHVRWWNHPELKALEAVIQPVGTAPYAGMGPRHEAAWPVVDAFLAGCASSETRRVGERLPSCLDRVFAALGEGSRTLCHGDYRGDNLMFSGAGGALELTALDWQVSMQARGTFDVGYLMSGSAPAELRREHELDLLRAYHARLVEGGVTGYGFDACLYDYRAALLVGYTYLVQAGAATDLTQPRTAGLIEAWAHRLDAAISQQGLAEFVD
jgi:hypothetical protein